MTLSVRIFGESSNDTQNNFIHDGGFCYGYGAFETCQIQNKNIILVNKHIDRLTKTLNWLSIPFTISKEALKTYCLEHLGESNTHNGSFNLYVTAGHKSEKILPFQNPKIISVIKSVEPIQTTPQTAYLQEEHTPRNQWSSHKTLAYAPNIYELIHTKKEGIPLLHSKNGTLYESPTASIGLFDGHTFTLCQGPFILPGITGKQCLKLAKSLTIQTKEATCHVSDLASSKEIALFNARGIQLIKSVDSYTQLCSGPFFSTLSNIYQDWIESVTN